MNEIVKNHISQVINEWLIGEKKYALESRAFVCVEELANGMLRMTFKTTVVCLNTFHSFSKEDSFEMRDVLGEEDVKSEVNRLKLHLIYYLMMFMKRLERSNNNPKNLFEGK